MQQINSEKTNEGKPTRKDRLKQNGSQKSKEIKKAETGSKLKEPKEEEEVRDKNPEGDKNTIGRITEESDKEKQILNTNSDSVTIRSRQLAVKGNEYAAQGRYMDAIIMFSEAIKLDPSDYR